MQAIILARVSSKEQEDNNSIPAQVRRLNEYAERNNLKIIETYQLVESSTKSNRQKFNEIISQIKKSKETIALVTDTIDRLQRGFKESVMLDELRRGGKLELHFMREGLVVNENSNSSDILRWDMGVIFSKSYVTQLSDNVKRSQQQKILNGEWLSKAPFGYKNTRKEGKAWIEPDENAEIVVAIFQHYAKNIHSVKGTQKWLKQQYGIEKPVSTIHKMLRDPFYTGKMRIKGQLYPHKYEPIISHALFDSAQQVASKFKKEPYKYAGLSYYYRGLITCGACGCRITPERKKGHVYYHCTQYKGKHGAKWLREEEVTRQIKLAIEAISPTEEQFKEVINTLKIAHGSHEKIEKNIKSHTEAELKKVNSRITRLFDSYLDQDIEKAEYQARRNDYTKQKEKLENKLLSLDSATDEWYKNAITIMELVRNAPLLFEKSSEIEEKRLIIKILFQNLELCEDQLRWKYKKPFDSMAYCKNHSAWLRRPDSNRRPID